MNSKAEFFRLAGSTVVIEYKNKSIITAIRIIEFGEKTTKFTLLNGDEVTIDNNQKLTRNNAESRILYETCWRWVMRNRQECEVQYNPRGRCSCRFQLVHILLETETKLKVSRAKIKAIPRQA